MLTGSTWTCTRLEVVCLLDFVQLWHSSNRLRSELCFYYNNTVEECWDLTIHVRYRPNVPRSISANFLTWQLNVTVCAALDITHQHCLTLTRSVTPIDNTLAQGCHVGQHLHLLMASCCKQHSNITQRTIVASTTNATLFGPRLIAVGSDKVTIDIR